MSEAQCGYVSHAGAVQRAPCPSGGAVADLIDWIYPVGSVITSVNADFDPNKIYNGTWTQFAAGKTLVGYASGDADFNAVNKTGGVKAVSYTPTGTNTGTAISVAQMPTHDHDSKTLTGTFKIRHSYALKSDGTTNLNTNSSAESVFDNTGIVTLANQNWSGHHYVFLSRGVDDPIYKLVTINATHTHTSQGSGQAHTHTFTGTAASISTLQPYITVYFWQRTA